MRFFFKEILVLTVDQFEGLLMLWVCDCVCMSFMTSGDRLVNFDMFIGKGHLY